MKATDTRKTFVSIYSMPGSVVSYVILINVNILKVNIFNSHTTLWNRYYYYPHFKGEETEPQRGLSRRAVPSGSTAHVLNDHATLDL